MADYIERRAAIDVLEERLQANGYSNVALVSELNRSIGYLMRLPSADVQPHQLTEEDLNELRHRFGKDVECVVRDMISGKDERWQNG